MNTSTVAEPSPAFPPAAPLKSIAALMARVAHLEADVTGQPPDVSFLANARLTGIGLFRLVVMGEIKKGKSSFINALLGTRNLVPVHSDVATSTIFKIHYGPEIKYTVYFEKETNREKLVIRPEQLNEYGTEDGNSDNQKGVEFIRVESPAPLLKSGLMLVDTPGVGGLFKKHREITFRHAPNADAVFFVTDSVESPIGADEVSFLKELRQITNLITFIQTKSSKADSAARAARMENNLSILKEKAGFEKKNLAYFIIDSGLKTEADEAHDRENLEDSGFQPLMVYLNQTLRRKKEFHIARIALSRTRSKMEQLSAILKKERAILNADTEEKRAAMDGEIQAMQRKLTEWDRTKKANLSEDIRKKFTDLIRKTQSHLDPLKPGGDIETNYSAEIGKSSDTETVQHLMRSVSANLAAETSNITLKIAENAEQEARKLLVTLQQETLGSLVETKETGLILADSKIKELTVNTSAADRHAETDFDRPVFDVLRTGVYGGMAGVTIAGIVGGMIGSVFPVVGRHHRG